MTCLEIPEENQKLLEQISSEREISLDDLEKEYVTILTNETAFKGIKHGIFEDRSSLHRWVGSVFIYEYMNKPYQVKEE